MNSMTEKQRMALRNLLGAIILADGLVKQPEIQAYAEKVCDLTDGQFGIAQETDRLLANLDNLRDRLKSNGARYWLAEQVTILKTTDGVTELLDAIWSVAVSDSDLHPNEAGILDYAFGVWIR